MDLVEVNPQLTTSVCLDCYIHSRTLANILHVLAQYGSETVDIALNLIGSAMGQRII